MLSLIVQILAVFAGWQIVRALPMKFYRLEAAAASAVIGTNLAAWVVFVCALILGWSFGLILAIVLLAAASAWTYRRFEPRYETGKVSDLTRSEWWMARVTSWKWWVQLVLSLFIAGVMIAMITASYNFPANGEWFSNGNVWGDAPLHVSLANQFAHGDTVDMVAPYYLRVPLSYPFLGDFWSGVQLRLGASWTSAMALPSLLMLLSVLQLIFSFGWRLLGSLRGAWLQLLMITFSGSLRGAFILGSVLLTQGIDAYNAKVGTSLAFATGDNYLNFIHSHLLPQRAYVFGMGMLIIAASIMLHIYRETKLHHISHETELRLGLIGGLIGGLLPLVHTHSFMVLMGLLVLSTALMAYLRRHVPAGWWLMVITTVALALPQLFWQFRTTYNSHFGHFIAGWMMQNFELQTDGNWFGFWFANIGLLFVAIMIGWFFLWHARAKAELWLTYVAGVVIFAICNLYVFQPSTWDNMKFFEYAFWMIMLIMAYFMARWSRRVVGAVLVAAAMVLMCAMGYFTLVLSGQQLTFGILTQGEVSVGQYVREKIPDNAYFLVGDRHNSPITMLGDRKVMMTFSGWYNLYDGNWPTTLSDRGTMLGGKVGAETLIEKYGVTYAAFDQGSVDSGEANLAFFRQHYALEYDLNGWYIFNLQLPAPDVVK